MTRFWIQITFWLTAGFAVVGGLIAHQWGWSEFASPELYVVYYQLNARSPRYFVVNADGSTAGQELVSKNDPITRVDCSPDGRVFAALTSGGHLYVLNAAGLLYDRAEPLPYTTVNVANDGTVDLFSPDGYRLLVNRQVFNLAAPNQATQGLDQFDLSAQGLVLWNRDFQDIRVTSLATGEVITTVPSGYSAQWLASGQIFSFNMLATDPDGEPISGGSFIMDVNHQTTMRIGYWMLSRPLSPDGTKVAAALNTNDSTRNVQVVVYDLFGDPQRQQLTDDPNIASQPLCFLTFKPGMLMP